MRIVEIQDCEIRPGRLVEWTLHSATVEAALHRPDDPRPPAYVQERHLRTARSACRNDSAPPSWIGTAFDIPGAVDLGALQNSLHAWTIRHETLRSGFRWVGEEVRRFTLDADAVALHREDNGVFTDVDKLAAYMLKRFDTVANALTWPNFMFSAVIRDESTSVYMAFDHLNVDYYSLQRIPAEIHELYATHREGRAMDVAEVASYVGFCATERAEADEIDATHALAARWRDFIAECEGELPNFPVDLGVTPDDPAPAQSFMYEMLVDGGDAAAFADYCRPYGGPLVGILAAVSLVAYQIGGQPVYRTVVPFYTRTKSQWSNSVGWYVGCAPVTIPVARAVDFDSALLMARASLRENRAMARTPLARVLHVLDADFRPTSADLHAIVSYNDGRDAPESERWHDLKAYALARFTRGDKACMWFSRLHEGLFLTSRFPDTGIAHKNMQLCFEGLRELIVSVPRHAPAKHNPRACKLAGISGIFGDSAAEGGDVHRRRS
ncbi:condensation domain-containing protein [Streptomyces sp. NPDC059070]|uniref:condensation domain-containing protein n=1 Tax=Streptomyces sp. NPDC059070 TaxID=3346713 RepID=UPI0036B6E12B